MNDIAIKVENLSKRYRIGAQQESYKTLRDMLSNAASAPLRWARAGRRGAAQSERDFWALNDVSFEVKRGEVVGIIGRNGAGKSTLLKILSRITEPTSGTVDIYGRVGSLLEVGTGFHPELTGRENIYLNGAILGMKREEIARQFDAIVEFAEVEKFVDTAVKHYSSGMYLRLAFAVAAHLEPEILLVDEVLAVGDAQFQKKCLGKMGEVAKQGRTVFFVSHNMDAIEQLCGEVFLLRAGQISSMGASAFVIAQYLNDAIRSSDGVFDYINHSARAAQYTQLIQSVTLCSSDGSPKTSFYPDEKLQVEIVIKSPDLLREPRIAFSVEDHLGRRIFTVASYFHTKQLQDVKGQSRILCTIPQLNLGSGHYLISVSVATKYQGLIDSVDSGAWFDVIWRNNYGNGEAFHPTFGPVIKQASWLQID